MIEGITDDLNNLVNKSVPKAEGVSKYGGVVYTLHPDQKEAQFCGIFPYKDYVQLSFSEGSSLKDPKGILTGTGKFRRHVNIYKAEQIDVKYFKTLIVQASKL